MTRAAMVVHKVHGSDANKLTHPDEWSLTLDCTGGYFVLTRNGEVTAHIIASVSLPTAAGLEDAIELLPSVGEGNVVVTGSNGGPFDILFTLVDEDANATFTSDATGLTGGASTAVLAKSWAFEAFDNTDGMSLVVTGNETIVLMNPSGGSPITVTVPSSADSQNRLNDALISTFSIPSPGWLVLPKFRALGWKKGAEGIHIDASGAGLKYLVLKDPTD